MRITILLALISICASAWAANPEKAPGSPEILNFMQIYHGYETRPAWHADQIKHYVFRERNGKPEWLFDGFLFLEIYARFNGQNYDYGATQPGKLPPGKAEWEHLICKTFEEGRGPDGLEATLDSLAREGFVPPTKRRVVFSIPNPIYGVRNWGFIGDEALDFHSPDDRVKAIDWYVSRILEEWAKKNYKHLEFGGFYWIHEQIDAQHQDDKMLKAVTSKLNAKNIRSYWLPHYGAEGVDRWQELGFSYAYQQPNYFLTAGIRPDALVRTIARTQNLNMGIMMEFDSRTIDTPNPYRRLYYDYIEAFRKGGVWAKRQPVNFYDGGDCWLKFATSVEPEVRKMYDALGDIIVDRNKRAVKQERNR